jgi:dihydrofolate reductase
VANHLDQAIQILSNEPFKDKIETIWQVVVINNLDHSSIFLPTRNVGGHDIYAMGLEHHLMHKMILTRINEDFECDVLFPKVDWDKFEQNNDFKEKEPIEEKGITWYITSYTRKNPC